MKLLILLLVLIIVSTTNTITGVEAGKSPPYFIQQPPNKELHFIEETNPLSKQISIKIPCVAKGDPAPTYFWTKNGQLLNLTSESERISLENGIGTLIIQAAVASDAGQYQCFAQNIWGIATSNSLFIRKVQKSSSLNEAPIVKQVIEGQPYHLTCNAPDTYPKSQVTWYKKNTDTRFSPDLHQITNPRITVDPTNTVWFSNITQTDTQDILYTCAVRLVYQSRIKFERERFIPYTRETVKLEIIPMNKSSEENKIAPVKQSTSGKNEIAVSGEKASLFCIFGGTPLPTITWYKNGSPVQFYRNGITKLKDYGKAIEIDRIISSDKGNYTCEASNGVGDPISHTIALKILDKPSFTKTPENITIAEGETAEIHCEARGDPTPYIQWIHNGKPLSTAPSDPRRTVSSNSIIFEKLQINDTGNYGCNATNSLGYVYQDVYLNVSEAVPPIFTELPEDVEPVEGDIETLYCRAKGLPKPRIIWFKDDVQLISSSRNTTIYEYGDLEIYDVTLASAGKYTCSAQNKIGSVNATANLVVRRKSTV